MSASVSDFSRREFFRATAALAAGAWAGCSRPGTARGRDIENMIVLGVDGMDPGLLRKYLALGKMPHCQKLIAKGGFWPLATTNPPQSPVAWSNFISGTNPGGHGIFDFIARDPHTMRPYLSVAAAEPPARSMELGKWIIPLSSGSMNSLRHGPTFWDDLQQQGIDCTIFRVPANFPPTAGEATTLSGMGTPDMQGGYGEFRYYSDDPQVLTKKVSGGKIQRLFIRQGMPKDAQDRDPELDGPINSFLKSAPTATVPFQAYIDPKQPVVKFVVQDNTFILKGGEWSDWITVRFTLLPFVGEVTGICRFYLKSAHKPFALYVTPINIDPANPSLPISTPPDYSQRLVRDVGYFYTQGMIEDTAALSANVFTPDDYRQQAQLVIDEQMRFYDYELDRFRGGFLFFYLSTLDRSSHVFWRTLDPQHPLYSERLAKTQGDFIPHLYQTVDAAIGKALERLDERTHLIVLSDHGFNSFRRQFNLNSWLMDNGYVRAKDPASRSSLEGLLGIDWGTTRAYGLGINGLYLNLAGREKEGSVQPGTAADQLADELILRLKQVRDPANNAQVINNVFKASEIYSGPHVGLAPDLIVAYNTNYRASWDTTLAGFPKEHVLDNTDAWSGDHCVDAQFVPGVLMSSRPLRGEQARIEDIAPTILAEFGAKLPAGMTGKSLWEP